MRWLVATSLRLRVIVVILMGLISIVGGNIIRNASFDVFPEFAPPYVEIQVEAPGLSTAEVESLIAVPIENALNGTPYTTRLHSKSVLGLASIVLHFSKGTNVIEAKRRHFAFIPSVTNKSNYTIKGFNLFACSITTDVNAVTNRSIAEDAQNITIDGIIAKYPSHQTDMTGNWHA